MISMGYTNRAVGTTARRQKRAGDGIDAVAAQSPDMSRTIATSTRRLRHRARRGTELDATMRPTHGGRS